MRGLAGWLVYQKAERSGLRWARQMEILVHNRSVKEGIEEFAASRPISAPSLALLACNINSKGVARCDRLG